jgi:hypothetical protein
MAGDLLLPMQGLRHDGDFPLGTCLGHLRRHHGQVCPFPRVQFHPKANTAKGNAKLARAFNDKAMKLFGATLPQFGV